MATLASMIAYLTAQLVDVQIFHLIKKLTRGKALWLRNNGSTLTSQMVDSIAVILITYFFTNAISITPGDTVSHGLFILILSNYVFKMTAALSGYHPLCTWVPDGFQGSWILIPMKLTRIKICKFV